MQKESFIFYRSFYEALADMDKESQADCLMAIAEYALNGKEPDFSPMVKMFFTLVKPQIDANQKRFENGCKGGRPKTKTKPNENQNKTKTEPNYNYNYTVNVNDNLKYNIGKNVISFGKYKINNEFNIMEVPDVEIYKKEVGEAIVLEVEAWLKKKMLGKQVDKNFICKQIYNFSLKNGLLEGEK